MPDFLRIAGTAVPVDARSATELEPTDLGTEDRSDAGTLRSSVQGIKRTWRVSTPPLPFADAAAVRALAPRGTFVACGGAFLVGPADGVTTVLCSVKVGDSPYVDDRSDAAAPSVLRVLTLTLVEV